MQVVLKLENNLHYLINSNKITKDKLNDSNNNKKPCNIVQSRFSQKDFMNNQFIMDHTMPQWLVINQRLTE